MGFHYSSGLNVLATLDSGPVTVSAGWALMSDTSAPPVGTRWMRIRLIATRHSGTTNDAYFDALSLRPMGAARVSLQGTVADDGLPLGSTLQTTWSVVSGPGAVTFANANTAATGAVFTVAGSYVLRLTASDGQYSSSDELTITVNPANQGPVVNAGADQTIALPNSANLNGTVTDDGLPAGSSLTTIWRQVSGPGTVTFANPNVTVTTASSARRAATCCA
jgi:hypothetical protein